MQGTQLNNIAGAQFRANPQYRLTLFDRLPPEQQEWLRDLRNDPDHYGVLLPAEGIGRSIKAVCRETALLFFTLQEPGPLPGYVQTLFGAEAGQEIAELVLDGVLEIAQGEAFVSGAEASALIYEAAPPPAESGVIARLSEDALRYAQTLDVDDPQMLSARLYFYNRLPVSPAWQRQFATPDAVRAFLGLNPPGSELVRRGRRWAETPLPPPYDGWLMWQARDAAREDAPCTYKLYVSPRPESLRDAFWETVDTLSDLGVSRFKIGKDVYGLLRPDKVVAYFTDFQVVEEAAHRLERALAGCPAHGVPFTAEIGGDGLLSWGMDPPRAQQALGWQERESWRLWVTNRLATALLAARAAPPPDRQPWQFAVERLALEGVDTHTWTPRTTLWQDSGGK
ncbi:MAG: hypothetical protein JO250_11120 [Armatimonadetes bacterium]|nr:hypothetical protein [Armatimonadota bacterium]